MKRINLLFAHPAPGRSRLNRALRDVAMMTDGVEVRDLYEMYPAMYVDADAERKAVVDCDVLVFQFPIYWFSSPAILKEWQDTVLSSGFAFGPGGDALQGKQFMLAVSTGGQEASYTETRPHGAPLSAFLRPFEQTAKFCGMTLLEPFIVHGVNGMPSEIVKSHAAAFGERLTELVRGDSYG